MNSILPQFEFCVFDFETTGLDPEQGAEIIEVGAVRVLNGDLGSEFHSYVQPEGVVPDKILDMTGIDPKKLKEAPTVKPVLNEFLDFVGDACLVAHNVSFDRPFLEKYAPCEILNPDLDTLRMARRYGHFESNKLGDLVDEFGIELDDAHRAVHDARATAQLFIRLSFMMCWDDLLSGSWLWEKNGKAHGPYGKKQLLSKNEFTETSRVCPVGKDSWQRASKTNSFHREFVKETSENEERSDSSRSNKREKTSAPDLVESVLELVSLDKFEHGIGTASKVLTGSNERKIRERELDELTLHGKHSSFTISRMKTVVKSLLNEDLLSKQKVGEFATKLVLTETGREVLEGDRTPPDIHLPDTDDSDSTTSTSSGSMSSSEISLTLFQDGCTIEEIAEERDLAVSTISGHLVSYVESGTLSARNLVDENNIRKILNVLEKTTEEELQERPLSTLKEKLPDSVEYADIKFVLADSDLTPEAEQDDPLKSYLENERELTEEVVVKMGDSGKERYVSDLLDGLTHENPNMRKLSCSALKKIGSSKPADELVKRLEDDHPQVRQYAISAIRKIGVPGAIPQLEAIAEDDPKEYVRDAAQSALESLT
ncbi:MAG: exonuclease domain-containing protein [bacterium]